jgi:hypothetical protein
VTACWVVMPTHHTPIGASPQWRHGAAHPRLAHGSTQRHHSARCGRYASFLPAEAVARLFHTVNPTPNVAPTWNAAPTQFAMVVPRHPESGERHLGLPQ